jgi:hypothetical protein
MSQNNQRNLRVIYFFFKWTASLKNIKIFFLCQKIAIEGNISSGKSSIINYLKRKAENRGEDILGDSTSNKILTDETNCEILTCKLSSNSAKSGLQSSPNKSSFDFLKQSNVSLKIIPEPVQLWRNLNGNNLLDLMYTDPEKWAFPFHSYVQLTMLQNHLELKGMDEEEATASMDANNENATFNADDLHINIMERSLYSAKYCFAENLYKS